ncbi:MAG: hypothetical protein QG671_775 [Actinomycetota bacterium]|nr:hypothetical protein [Actinomycetota bacterium]
MRKIDPVRGEDPRRPSRDSAVGVFFDEMLGWRVAGACPGDDVSESGGYFFLEFGLISFYTHQVVDFPCLQEAGCSFSGCGLRPG